jgi:hypothetical protein
MQSFSKITVWGGKMNNIKVLLRVRMARRAIQAEPDEC